MANIRIFTISYIAVLTGCNTDLSDTVRDRPGYAVFGPVPSLRLPNGSRRSYVFVKSVNLRLEALVLSRGWVKVCLHPGQCPLT